MTRDGQLAAIERDGRRIIDLGRAAPEATVPQYPGWTLRDLVVHVGRIHARTEAICRTLPAERIATPELPPGADPAAWAADRLGDMLEALAAADPNAAAWTFTDDPSVGFWMRRMIIETGVHAWDAASAVGDPGELPADVSGPGLDEFASLYLPRLGDVSTVELRATDLGRSWRFGAGAPSTTVEDRASALFLRLMQRPGSELPPDWTAAVDALAAPAGP